MAPHLPGFYYDEEKKKYFKIQANHQAPPNSNYTREDVKRRNLDTAESKLADEIKNRKKLERVQKSEVLEGSLNYLDRELGVFNSSAGRSKDLMAKEVVKGLQPRLIFDLRRTDVTFRPGSLQPVLDCLRSKTTGALFYLHSRTAGPQAEVYYAGDDEQVFPLSGGLAGAPGFMSNSPTGHVLTGYLHDSGGTFLQLNNILPHGSDSNYFHWPGKNLTIPKMVITQASARRSQTGTYPEFALATEKGLFIMVVRAENRTNVWKIRSAPNPLGRVDADHRLSTTDWFDKNLVVSGGAGRVVSLSDLRSGTSTRWIPCDGPVTHIKSLNDHQLVMGEVAHNIETKMTTHDLRYVRQTPDGRPVPFLEFEPYRFADAYTKFDVDTELGLLATINHRREVILYSLQTGRAMESRWPKVKDASCVRFDNREGAYPSLLIGGNERILEASWEDLPRG